jgi:hypothetical protein
MGSLRRTRPLSDNWGFDRGTPVDRYYIEKFLGGHVDRIHGRVLEIKDSGYTRKFGRGVERADVLDVDPNNRQATFVADLSASDSTPSNAFQCFILTQTLHLIYDLHGAIRHSHRMLAPGGTLLVTLPALSRVPHGDGLNYDYWRFTIASARKLFGGIFGADNVEVKSHGNVLAGIAFLAGLACEELTTAELETYDPYFPLIVSVVATKC